MVPKNIINRAALIFVFMFCALVWAPYSFADMAQKVDELIIKSGLERQIGQLPEVIAASFDQRVTSDSQLKPEQVAKITAILNQSFNPAQMIQSFKEQIGKSLPEAEMDGTLVWLNSPLGQKITQLEENASSAEAFNQMQTFAMGLQNNPPQSARMEILNQLDQAAHISEYSIKMKMDMIMTMTESMAVVTGQDDFSKSDLMSQIEASRTQIEEGSRQESLISGLFTYQSLTDEEIKQYVDFYTSAAGVKYAEVITEALLDVFEKSSKKMGEGIGRLIKDEKKAQETAR